ADLEEVEPLELQEALWDLVWAGEATNDAFAPLRAPRLTLASRERNLGRRFARRRRPGAPQVQGRWSLTAPLFADAPPHGPRLRPHPGRRARPLRGARRQGPAAAQGAGGPGRALAPRGARGAGRRGARRPRPAPRSRALRRRARDRLAGGGAADRAGVPSGPS